MNTEKKLLLGTIILLSSLTGCKSENYSSTSSSSSPVLYAGLATSPSSWPGVCQEVSVSITGSSNTSRRARVDLFLDIASNFGNLYSDSACTQAASSVGVTRGFQNSTFYFKSSTAGSAVISASKDPIAPASEQITITRPSADLVLGQANFTSNTANDGGISAQTLNLPYAPMVIANKVFVADTGNNRVLIWNSSTPASGQAANVVLGQPDMTSDTANNGGVSAQSLSTPDNVYSDGTHLIVADSNNNRVLIWNTIPTSNQQAANIVLGQPDMTSNTDNNGGLSASSLSYPECVFSDGTKLIVCDANNNRILIWNTFPTANNQAANVVLGQPDMTTNNAGATATGLGYPCSAFTQNGRLIIDDYNNNRVLIWNSVPTVSGQAANVALGQPDLTSNAANNGGVSDSSLFNPGAALFDSQGRVIVSDYMNSRILIWNQVPSTSGVAADAVIGQPDFLTTTANQGGLGTESLQTSWGISVSGGYLWVSDYANSRILRYTMP